MTKPDKPYRPERWDPKFGGVTHFSQRDGFGRDAELEHMRSRVFRQIDGYERVGMGRMSDEALARQQKRVGDRLRAARKIDSSGN